MRRVLACLALLMVGCDYGTTRPTLKAAIKNNALVLSVTNEDARDWANVDVAVNTDSMGVGGFKAHLDALKAGDAHLFMLTSFVDRDGNRFNPLSKAVVSARVDAETESGKPRETAFVRQR